MVDQTPAAHRSAGVQSLLQGSRLGAKLGFDDTHKWPGETNRVWGQPIPMTEGVRQRVDAIWEPLNIL